MINPIIYGLLNRRYRESILDILPFSNKPQTENTRASAMELGTTRIEEESDGSKNNKARPPSSDSHSSTVSITLRNPIRLHDVPSARQVTGDGNVLDSGVLDSWLKGKGGPTKA